VFVVRAGRSGRWLRLDEERPNSRGDAEARRKETDASSPRLRVKRHSDVKTTVVYTHVLGLGASGVRRPLDALDSPKEDRCHTPTDNRAMTASGMSQPVGLEHVTIKPVTSPFGRYLSRRRFRRPAKRGSITS